MSWIPDGCRVITVGMPAALGGGVVTSLPFPALGAAWEPVFSRQSQICQSSESESDPRSRQLGSERSASVRGKESISGQSEPTPVCAALQRSLWLSRNVRNSRSGFAMRNVVTEFVRQTLMLFSPDEGTEIQRPDIIFYDKQCFKTAAAWAYCGTAVFFAWKHS